MLIEHWFGKKQSEEKPNIGLILPGGGARGAYQVGVLRAIQDLLPPQSASPFPIVTGTSAGSLNAAMVASRSSDYADSIRRLHGMWENLQMEMVVRTEASVAAKTMASWLWSFASFGGSDSPPKALLDNSPLRRLLESHVNFARMRQCIASGHLQALGITSSSYSQGSSVTHFEGQPELENWGRTRRFGISTRLSIDHMMASIAIPVVFPAVRIEDEYHGDGSMREAAPLSPALHLGANKLLIISVRNPTVDEPPKIRSTPQYPTLGHIAGYVFDTLFMDRLDSDIERLNRINFALSKTRRQSFRHGDSLLRPVEFLVISPSVDIRSIVAKHTNAFPRTIKMMLSGIGAMAKEGRPLTSYLLFHSEFCRELIELGYNDAEKQKDKIQELLEL